MATWRVMIWGINGMTLGFPAGFSIVLGPHLKLLLFNFSSTFQRAETDQFFQGIFLRLPFFSRFLLRCASAVPPLEVRFTFLFSSFFFFFFYCSVISDLLFLFASILLLVFLLGFLVSHLIFLPSDFCISHG